MPTLFETIQRWADGQNRLNALEPEEKEALQEVVGRLVASLRRHASLGDLASSYYGEDTSTQRIAEEFEASFEDTDLLRNAAHWQRFMEIRHPEIVPNR